MIKDVREWMTPLYRSSRNLSNGQFPTWVSSGALASEDKLLGVKIRVALLYSYLLSITGINAQTRKPMYDWYTS